MESPQILGTQCKHCGRYFNVGRRDKLFCSPRCRSAYHNDQNRNAHNAVAKVERRLRMNYRILLKTLSNPRVNPEAIPQSLLVWEGYDFSVSVAQTVNPKTKRTVYWTFHLGLEKSLANASYRLHTRAV